MLISQIRRKFLVIGSCKGFGNLKIFKRSHFGLKIFTQTTSWKSLNFVCQSSLVIKSHLGIFSNMFWRRRYVSPICGHGERRKEPFPQRLHVCPILVPSGFSVDQKGILGVALQKQRLRWKFGCMLRVCSQERKSEGNRIRVKDAHQGCRFIWSLASA